MLFRLLSALGWRNAVAGLCGAFIAVVPSYQAGRLVERATFPARLDAQRLADRLSEREAAYARFKAAERARVAARLEHGAGVGAGGLPDDGWRRE